jgi:hypothetical protein
LYKREDSNGRLTGI